MIFDSHCHLDPETFGGDDEVDAVVATAVAAGVNRMLTVGSGYGEGTAGRAVAVANRHPGCVWASVGMHPHDAQHFNDAVEEELRGLAAQDCVVAWGEIGLDFFRNLSPPEVQRRAFREQLALAVELDLPVVIHSRDADAEVEPILMEWAAAVPRRPRQPVGVLHCFSGDAELAVRYARAGFMISFAGVVTYPKNDALREAARAVGAESIVVETDCPYLTPQFKRGKRNEPAYVAETARFIAELRGEGAAKFAKTTLENGRRLFRLPATAKMTR